MAAAAAMCGGASAASVTLYGVVDTGFAYNSVDADGYNANGFGDLDGDSFGMQSGQRSGSRFGFKGEEELGNGLTIKFVLESAASARTTVPAATTVSLTVKRACRCLAPSVSLVWAA